MEGFFMMKCNRCGNEDTTYFYQDQQVCYCRKCIAFGRVDVGKDPPLHQTKKKRHKVQYQLQYPLTPRQAMVVEQIAMYQEQGCDVLVYAACGAGKTELVMDSIMRYLNAGKKVGFAISRRQVVLEIQARMAQAFKGLHVIAVCEGFTEVVDGDLIICTMHQLYRYHQAFDLLIMDEVDAFPYRNNEMLEHIAMNACVGRKLYLTATPDEAMLQKVRDQQLKMVELFQRPHGYPLIVPKVKQTLASLQKLYLLRFLKEHRRQQVQVLVFVPTIREAHALHRQLRWFFRCTTFTSKTEDKEAVIDRFHDKQYDFLISTTILERGITIRGIHIVILHADHPVFNEASLIQMIGRVGRKLEDPTGEGYFLCKQKTNDILRCVHAIEKMNESCIVSSTATSKTVRLQR